MHASIWKLTGDPAGLVAGYESLLAAVPAANMRLHVCLRAPDGLVILDTCPSEEVFRGFASGFPALCEAHGLPRPELVQDAPVHLAYVDGASRS